MTEVRDGANRERVNPDGGVCYHGFAVCVFCWPDGRPAATSPAKPLVCSICGRKATRQVKLDDTDRCAACRSRRFRSLRLFAWPRKARSETKAKKARAA